MIVVADDITGAAEIAGIAAASGQKVRLVCCSLCCNSVAAYRTTDETTAIATDETTAITTDETTAIATDETSAIATDETTAITTDETTVVATDTRSLTEAEAMAEMRRIGSAVKGLSMGNAQFSIFKKTDSALRGHVVAELTSLMEATGYQRAVYMPANPSKGRIIRDGVYYINGKPIHETDFSFDPEFPARTSVLKERFPDAERLGIVMPDAESEKDIRHVIAKYQDGHTLFAGAADLFKGMMVRQSSVNAPISCRGKLSNALILCGSTQSKPLDLGISICPMPREVYDGRQGADYWFQRLTPDTPSLILTIPHTHRTGKEVAVHLRTVMAEMTKRLAALQRPDQLIIEGGATAWATLQALGWTQFDNICQIAPGVVQMSATNGTLVTLKPGSYPWGNLFSPSGNK